SVKKKRMLRRGLEARGHEVVVLSRHADPARGIVAWDGRSLGPWVDEIDGADAVINLTGRSVNCRYHEANLLEMMSSRVDSARVVGEAIARCERPPAVWLQASTATIYAHHFGPEPHDESGVLGGHEPDVPRYWARSTDIAKSWEAHCLAAETPHTRKVLLRSSYIMSADEDGIFDVLNWLVSWGLGGPVIGGHQMISWIHEHDLVRAILLIIEDERLSGPVNLAAPHPLSQGDAMRVLREARGVSLALPIAHWMAKIGAVWLQTDVELIEKSRCVVSRKLDEAGFDFAYPEWSAAVDELLSRWPIPDAA
ncbi:MAG: DUF1731 domain-containing protein, partial [Deltaproteobacteria bacterium]